MVVFPLLQDHIFFTVIVNGNYKIIYCTQKKVSQMYSVVTHSELRPDSWMRPNSRILPETSESESVDFFAAVSDDFGSSVRESIFTYQVAVFKRRCVTVCGRQYGHVRD